MEASFDLWVNGWVNEKTHGIYLADSRKGLTEGLFMIFFMKVDLYDPQKCIASNAFHQGLEYWWDIYDISKGMRLLGFVSQLACG